MQYADDLSILNHLVSLRQIYHNLGKCRFFAKIHFSTHTHTKKKIVDHFPCSKVNFAADFGCLPRPDNQKTHQNLLKTKKTPYHIRLSPFIFCAMTRFMWKKLYFQKRPKKFLNCEPLLQNKKPIET